MSESENRVIDHAKSSWSDLWKKEDYWAIWLGFLVIIFAYSYFVQGFKTSYDDTLRDYGATMAVESAAPFPTLAYLQAEAGADSLEVADEAGPSSVLAVLKMPTGWASNPLRSVYLSQAEADTINESMLAEIAELENAAMSAYTSAFTAETLARDANFTNEILNTSAQTQIALWQEADSAYNDAMGDLEKPYNLIPNLILLGAIFALMFAIGGRFMGYNVPMFLAAFGCIFALAIVAAVLGKQEGMSAFGLNTEVWAIIIGMLIANTVGTPKFMAHGVQVEYYIKTGLVCLGAEVLFGKLLAIGIPGIFVTWVVTPIVLVTTYIFGQKILKIPSKTLNITISADMSVCGTSAAIAAASACGAKKEELTLSVGLSLTFTAIMMIVIPSIANALGFPEVLAGAWIGGTVDSTGAVAAAGALIGPTAMQVAATIKMIQNILIGVTSFFIAVYWATKVEAIPGQKVSVMEIWHRFPKFVLGFLLASIVCSAWSAGLENVNGIDLSSALFTDGMLKFTMGVKSWCFALAFLTIGLATDFRVLSHYFKGGKPVILYVCGQTFNLCLTLLMAYIMFYLVFPDITASL